MLTGLSFPVAFPLWEGEGEKKEGNEEVKERRKDGRKYRSEQASFSEASRSEEKGRQEPDGHLCMFGGRGSQGPQVPQ